MSEIRLHSQDSEQSILGALLLDPVSIDNIGALKPGHFYDEAHRIILAEIMAMVAAGKPVDVITVAEELHDHGNDERTGGLSYLGSLVENTPSSRSIRRYAEIVVGKALERQLLAASETIKEIVESTGSTNEKLTSAQSAVMSISESVASRQPKIMAEVLVSAVDTLEKRSGGNIRCLATGFSDLDRQLSGGLRPGNLIVLAGRPAMGKTSLAVNIGYKVARENVPVLVLSMEMPEQELADRLISQAGAVYLSAILAGDMEGENGERIMAGVGKLSGIPLVIDDQGGLNLFDVASKARSVKRKHGLGLLVIDYLQLMSGEGSKKDNRNQEIEQITRGLKALAKELDIPIVALSQLSRKCEERTNKRPMNSDLRESGAIEQDADVILFVYRDEEYNPHSPDKGTAEIIISKNRQGQNGMVRMIYQGCYTRFDDLAPGWQPAHQEESKPPARKRGMSDF